MINILKESGCYKRHRFSEKKKFTENVLPKITAPVLTILPIFFDENPTFPTTFSSSPSIFTITSFPANIFLFKVNNRNSRKKCEICLNLTIKTPERRHWCPYC